MSTANGMTVVVQAHPTALSKFMLRYWYVGWVIALFVRWMPVEWLVRTELVEVKK